MTEQNREKFVETIDGALKGMPFKFVCITLIEALLDLPISNTKFLTYTSFVNLAGKSTLDEEIIAAINFLSSSSRYSILEPHALYVDEESGQEFDLDAITLSSFWTDNILVHPETGEVVEEPLSHLCPYFVLSEEKLEELTE